MSSERRPHFFAFYSANLSSERLKIPTKFVKHMEGRTSGAVSLEGPSGNTWLADLVRQNDDLFVQRGWPAFVRDHYVECGDFLIFRYNGNLHFTVQVFDQSACEKEAAFRSECSQGNSVTALGQKRDRQEGASSSDRIVEGVLKKMRESPSQLYSERLHSGESTIVTKDTYQYAPMPKSYVLPSQAENCNGKPAADMILFKPNAVDNLNLKGDGFNVNGRVCVQVSSAQEVAQSFSSTYPFFVKIMKSFNVGGSYTLNIPCQFSITHLPNCKVKIVLQNMNGECWTVNSIPSTRVNTSHTLCGGWMAFVRYNDIKIGDVCIFELVGQCEFRVHHIVGVRTEEIDSQNGKVASNLLSSGHAVTSHKSFKGLSKKMRTNSSKVHSKSIKMLSVSDKKVSKKLLEAAFPNDTKKYGSTSKALTKASLCSQSKVAKKKLGTAVHRSRGVEDDLGSQVKSGLRMMLALDEERAARNFSSCFPNFVKIMKKFNISGSYTLKIPYQFSTAHLPNYKTEILLRNLKGECWTVNSVPDSKGRLVHTFCGGWMAFVRGNNINIGDICIFELVGEGEMRVHISGSGKRGLDYRGADSTPNELALISSTSNHLSL